MEFNELFSAVVGDVRRCGESVDPQQVCALVDALATKRKVLLVGAGRSGAMLEAMRIRLGHLDIDTHVAGSPGCPPVQEGDLVLVASGAGRTPVSLETAAKAHDAGARLAVITADTSSPIAGLADIIVHVPAPLTLRHPTPHTLRSLFEECLLIICDCVCRMLQDRLGLSAAAMQSRHSCAG